MFLELMLANYELEAALSIEAVCGHSGELDDLMRDGDRESDMKR